MMCSLYAKGELGEIQLEKSVRKFDALIDQDKNKKRIIPPQGQVDRRYSTFPINDKKERVMLFSSLHNKP